MDGVSLQPVPQANQSGFWPNLPAEAPLAMPAQPLHHAPAPQRMPASEPGNMIARRLLVIGGAVLMTAAATHEMVNVLNVGGFTVLELLILVMFVTLFAWIALSFTSAVCGFVAQLSGGGTRLGTAQHLPLPQLSSRTALLMPVYNEAPARVMAGLQVIHESLQAIHALDHFDIFILSDTTDPDAWIAEEAAFLALRERTGNPHIFYRRRPQNIERKAGNIAEWVKRFGGAYPQMLILDADSVMTGQAIVRLVGAMERHPDVGLIQSLPVIVNGTTLFARMQQFAGRVYGPMIAQGIAWWHGAEGNYWGHNAVIRTQAFAGSAGLPTLSGRKPFGGHILSHDFVEAALMRRAGWAIHMVPGLPGSYEEGPPSLIDLAVRDRRWCQGNLQHLAVLPASGLHWVSRMHLLMGIGSYITAPIWLMFLITGILISLQARFVPPDYFPAGRTLFPNWPNVDPVRSMWLFIGTMGILLAPKLLAYVALLCDGPMRRGCGGALRSLLSILVETILAGLLAPVTMIVQSVDVGSILLGRDGGWQAQRRDDGSVPFGDIVRRIWKLTVFGIALAVAAYLVSTPLALWMSPVILGLALAIPLVAITGLRGTGQVLRRMGILRIPEEVMPPPELARSHALMRMLRDAPAEASDATLRLMSDPHLLAAHLAMLPPPRVPGRDPIDASLLVGRARIDEAPSLVAVLAQLSKPELAAVLGNADALHRLVVLRDAR